MNSSQSYLSKTGSGTIKLKLGIEAFLRKGVTDLTDPDIDVTSCFNGVSLVCTIYVRITPTKKVKHA